MHAHTEERTLRFAPDWLPASPDAPTEEVTRAGLTRGHTRPVAPLPIARAEPRAVAAERVVRALFPSALVLALVEVRDLDGFRAAWLATRQNAMTCGNPVVAGAACVLLDATGRLGPADLVEGVIVVCGHTFEVWVDTTRELLLTAIPRPDLDRS